MYRCLMMDSGTRMPSGSCGGLHDPTYQSHGPASWGHLIGDMWSVVDVFKGVGIARSGAERVLSSATCRHGTWVSIVGHLSAATTSKVEPPSVARVHL